MVIYLSNRIKEKLEGKHGTLIDDVVECFANRTGNLLIDTREEHKTEPETQWFIAETNRGVELKICFMQFENGDIAIKTAYPPNQEERRIYKKYGLKD